MSDEGQTGQANEGSTGGQKSLEERLKEQEERINALTKNNERLLNESKDWKTKAQTASEREAERLKQIEQEKQQELIAKGEYKKLLEQQKEENARLAKEMEDALSSKAETEKTLIEAKKLSAFENRLGGKLKNDKYLGFVDTSSIIVDPETGQIDVSSVDNTVKGFLGEHKDLVTFGAGKMPAFEGGASKSISVKQWQGMSHKERLNNLSAAFEADKNKRKKS